MSFEMVAGQARTAIDLDTGSRMSIKRGPQLEVMVLTFSSPEFSLSMSIWIRAKFPDQSIATNDVSNPCIMVPPDEINAAFVRANMQDQDLESNTRLAKYIIRMIAFIANKSRLANTPFLWSNQNQVFPVKWYFKMPSDAELLKISLDPESNL